MSHSVLDIKATRNTPGVLLDTEKNIFYMVGNSLPENASEFYSPIVELVKQAIPHMTNGAIFTFCLPYFNSSSLKAVYLLLKEIKEAMDGGRHFEIVWHIEEDDDFMSEAAETFTEMTGITFTFKTGILGAAKVA